MPQTWYERLSILDYSFLAFEGPTTYMHIAALATLEVAGLRGRHGGIDIDRIRKHIASRLLNIPRYRQRLAYIPLENRPVWVDDHEFDLARHVRHSSVPRPGSEAQLRELCSRLLERPLNRTRPLWEIWVIEGLEDDQFALLVKVHHCMVDGLAGAEILSALLSPSPETDIEEPAEWRPRPAPSAYELLGDELGRRAKMAIDVVRALGSAVRAPAREGTPFGGKLAQVWQLVRGGMRRPTTTPLNRRIGPYRRFHWATHDLGEIKDIKNRLGGTVNDVVLSVVAGAVRQFFLQHDVAVNAVDFRVAVPVSTRAVGESISTGNRVSAWLFPLPVQEADPVRRLRAVRQTSGRFKETNHAMGGELLVQAAEWTSTNVLTLGAHLANQTQPFNLIVTNVPGPQFPLFLAGAPLMAVYPQVPLFENQCLGIALFSYAGQLHWGFNADFDALPDADQFVEAIECAFHELRKAAHMSATPVRARRTRRSPRSPEVTGSIGRHAAQGG